MCSCLSNYIGSPPNCRAECLVSSECPQDKACVGQKCVDPCTTANPCGFQANCQVVNHSPICSCPRDHEGDPFIKCILVQRKVFSSRFFFPNLILSLYLETPEYREPTHPCIPSPCGQFSQCREINNQPVCSCLKEYIGRPPNCRPECVIQSDCPANLACINERCKDPCPGSCGFNSECIVINHSPICSCQAGYTGDPFSGCNPIPRKTFLSIKYLKSFIVDDVHYIA